MAGSIDEGCFFHQHAQKKAAVEKQRRAEAKIIASLPSMRESALLRTLQDICGRKGRDHAVQDILDRPKISISIMRQFAEMTDVEVTKGLLRSRERFAHALYEDARKCAQDTQRWAQELDEDRRRFHQRLDEEVSRKLERRRAEEEQEDRERRAQEAAQRRELLRLTSESETDGADVPMVGSSACADDLDSGRCAPVCPGLVW